LEELLSPKELSNLLKVSKPWPYIMVKRGVLPCYKMGNRLGKRDEKDSILLCPPKYNGASQVLRDGLEVGKLKKEME
jgi:excisionase family DNA binding protein